ncbi:MAG: hypothetical protein COZ80_03385 [Ignavibacteria bacterium CG_4_8_14_3_um_filter_37_9]|nr:hypothetical protein [Ignavibacteria bacterium]OIO20209.1 MAG: hypothetical protein AUJ54_05860 [Ignavibacteria bacterium CG1_02_37_35]PIS44092.1 MAG: hypothetical protein COT22_12400 [Ignavibacteria bacterium CG08_land_8_20_14_0_20_37_9]PIW99830.1 MAG: hypothetical protein COZ80_03385 [Ignavibacteria bacterium CG_4_8_14_3_um_filter_37_9]PIX92950.1 MAG: hypothetical protein COZ25_13175 [Ignavibacteria bacterium CG_4_10_14_3_um_filter_37_18]PJC60654.1 MAG: hypothetical protein CO025_02580 [I
MEKHLSVLRYPHDDEQLKNVIDVLNNFIAFCSKEFKVNIKIKAVSTVELNPTICNLLQKFLSFSEKHFRCADIQEVNELLEIMKNPPAERLYIIKQLSKSNETFWEFFHTTEEIATSLEIKEVFQFISLKNLKLKNKQGPWGIAVGVYPHSIAIDTTGFKESIFHEFLHQLGVLDGYDYITHTTTCVSSCWMQYTATFGNSLCEEHSKELINFIKRWQLN